MVRGVKWIGRPAGSSGSRGVDGRYQDWYGYKEMEGESFGFYTRFLLMLLMS